MSTKRAKRTAGGGKPAPGAVSAPNSEKEEKSAAAAFEPEPKAALPRREYNPEQRVVALTGPAWFLGRNLISMFEADSRYYRIIALGTQQPATAGPKTLFFKLDLTQPHASQKLADILSREEVDTFLHLDFLASPTHNVSWAHELEAIGTMYVFDACAQANVHKVVMNSTTAVYGAYPGNPNFLSERHFLKGNPGSRFFSDKVEAEKQARSFSEHHPETIVTVLRCATILGKEINNFITRYLAFKVTPVVMGYDPLLQFLHEQDALSAFKLAADEDFPGEYNIVGKGVLPLRTILRLLGRMALPVPHPTAYPLTNALWAVQIISMPSDFLNYIRYPWVADGAKAERVMGFSAKHDIRRILLDYLSTEHRRKPLPTVI